MRCLDDSRPAARTDIRSRQEYDRSADARVGSGKATHNDLAIKNWALAALAARAGRDLDCSLGSVHGRCSADGQPASGAASSSLFSDFATPTDSGSATTRDAELSCSDIVGCDVHDGSCDTTSTTATATGTPTSVRCDLHRGDPESVVATSPWRPSTSVVATSTVGDLHVGGRDLTVAPVPPRPRRATQARRRRQRSAGLTGSLAAHGRSWCAGSGCGWAVLAGLRPAHPRPTRLRRRPHKGLSRYVGTPKVIRRVHTPTNVGTLSDL